VQHGVFLPPFDELADPTLLQDIAITAEEHGWDGLFLWDHVAYTAPVVALADTWTCLAAVAAVTSRLRIGPLVTPLPRRRPVVVARQAATLDRLSAGRLTLGVGIGSEHRGEFAATGEEADPRRRAEMLDEALAVLVTAWSGAEVSHQGRHYTVDGVRFLPRPRQQPHPPVWVSARFGRRTPLRRAARWQGVFPIELTDPSQLADVVATVAAERGGGLPPDFEVVAAGPPDTDPAGWAKAGATWWLTQFGVEQTSPGFVFDVIRRGPPGPG
jgi:alkanesulfonate monooxygenase SsuD/methylene tetrahydromethanopterin reductase-like flavin-dependent oxidoreductase (luciferase family)